MQFSFDIGQGGVNFGGGTSFSDYIHGRNVERIRALTKAEFDALDPIDTTLYLVQDTNGIKLYLGNTGLYADDIPADVDAELRRIAVLAQANADAIEDDLSPAVSENTSDISALQTSVAALTTTVNGMTRVVALTQAEYDALDPPDEDTVYIIKAALNAD